MDLNAGRNDTHTPFFQSVTHSFNPLSLCYLSYILYLVNDLLLDLVEDLGGRGKPRA